MGSKRADASGQHRSAKHRCAPQRAEPAVPGAQTGTNTLLHDTPARQAEIWCHCCLVVGKATVHRPPSKK